MSFNNLQMQLVTGVRYESTPKSFRKVFEHFRGGSRPEVYKVEMTDVRNGTELKL